MMNTNNHKTSNFTTKFKHIKANLVSKKSTKAAGINPENHPTDARDAKATKSAKGSLKLPHIRKIHIKISYAICIAILLVFGIFFARVAVWEHDYISAMEGSERHKVTTEGGNSDDEHYDGGEEYDNTQPTTTQISEYIVAPDKPRYFSIPSLGITNARMVEVGLLDNNEIGTPYNIYDVGWYTGSALPGTNGVSMIDAHGGDLGTGIFRTLPRIQIGAIITVEMGDGRLYTYRVTDTATKDLGEAANEYMAVAGFVSPQEGVGSMTIVTCTGAWSQMRQTYLQRLFVRAVLQ